MAIVHVDNTNCTLRTKPQGTDHNIILLPLAHALYKHYEISAFLKDAGGGPETRLPLGVAL